MNGVAWYDSKRNDQRRKCVRWQPSGLINRQPMLGYILYAQRSDPFDLWPVLRHTPQGEPVTLEVARSFAVGYGCEWSDDDPGGRGDDAPALALVPASGWAAGTCSECGRAITMDGPLSFNSDDGQPHSCPPPADDPDSYTEVSVNLTAAQARVVRNLVDGLLTFAPDDAELRYLRAKLDRAAEGVR